MKKNYGKICWPEDLLKKNKQKLLKTVLQTREMVPERSISNKEKQQKW